MPAFKTKPWTIMQKRIFIYMQYLVPQHLVSVIMGWFAKSHIYWFKNWMIKRFIKKYHVDMSAAVITDPEKYPDFNSFFIRKLKPDLRPIVNGLGEIACPVDGT